MEEALSQNFDPSAIAAIRVDTDGLLPTSMPKRTTVRTLVTVMANLMPSTRRLASFLGLMMTDGSGRTALPASADWPWRAFATEISGGYRRKTFTSRDVVDDTIAALEATR